MSKHPPLCTPATVGILSEDNFSTEEISRILKQPESLIKRYLKEWTDATPYDRHIARSGTRPYLGK